MSVSDNYKDFIGTVTLFRRDSAINTNCRSTIIPRKILAWDSNERCCKFLYGRFWHAHPDHDPGKRAAHAYDWFALGGILVKD